MEHTRGLWGLGNRGEDAASQSKVCLPLSSKTNHDDQTVAFVGGLLAKLVLDLIKSLLKINPDTSRLHSVQSVRVRPGAVLAIHAGV